MTAPGALSARINSGLQVEQEAADSTLIDKTDWARRGTLSITRAARRAPGNGGVVA
jgi:hypothetical protein